MEKQYPEHELLKRNLADKFTTNSSYLGSHIKNTIMQTDFKVLKNTNPPTEIRKGDVVVSYEGVKSRPSVIIKVLEDKYLACEHILFSAKKE